MSNIPQSRNEAILQATIDGTAYTAPPQSRIEDLLIQLKEAIEAGGGGGGGTTNYNALSNKPQIASTTLEGNLSLADLGIQGVLTFDNLPTEDSANPVKSGGIYTALGNKQDTLTFDNSPTENSTNPVKSGGIYTALAGKQDKLTFDSSPTENSTNPVTSGGVYTALGSKQDTLTFDNSPTEDSANPVKSGGIYTALGNKQDTLTFDNSPTENSTNPVKSGGIYTALAGKEDKLTFDSSPTENSNNPVKSGGIYAALSGKVDTLVSLDSTADLDDIKTSGFYKCTGATNSPVTNVSLLVMGYDANNCHQQAVDIATGDIYHRSLIGGTWGSWATAMNLIHS